MALTKIYLVTMQNHLCEGLQIFEIKKQLKILLPKPAGGISFVCSSISYKSYINYWNTCSLPICSFIPYSKITEDD